MPAYISLVNFTDQGVKNAKGTVERSQAVRKMTEAAKGRIIGFWWTLGQYDMVVIVEAPDEATAVRQLIATGMQGNTRTMTMRAFSEEEMTKILQGLP